MKFHNETDQGVQVGIYRDGNAWPGEDTLYWFSLFPFGAVKSIPKQGALDWDSKGRFKRVQVIFWIGHEKIGPSSCSTSADVTLTRDKVIVQGTGPATIKDKITHFVVLMLENRSFDSVLGWLYADQHNKPSYNLPPQAPPTYAGLEENKYWNTVSASDHDKAGAKRVYAQKVSSSSNNKWYTVPCPNPHEVYPYFIEQMFGTEAPDVGQQPNMSGFLANYHRVSNNKRPEQIMECYTPDQLPVLSKLAIEFAVGDRWFGSIPCETWPNRSFLHAGTSYGRLNNCDGKYNDVCIPNFMVYAGKRTIFDVLDEQEVSYCVFHDGLLRPLVSYQFWNIRQKIKRENRIRHISAFEDRAKSGCLPTYSFIEPEYVLPPNDQHPNTQCDMRRGEKLLQRIWNAISGSPLYKNILFIITYDEHGGCYDHVAPPSTATPPDGSPPQYADIKLDPFKQYGPRVPAVVVSPYIRPSTVFRSDSSTNVEYDHTSILATLRDWIFRSGVTPTGASAGWLDSKRIDKAPTLWPLLILDQPRTEIPDIPGGKLGVPIALPMPARACTDLGNPAVLNALSKSQIVEAEALRRFHEQCAPTITDMTEGADDYNNEYAQIQQEVCDECNKDMSKCHEALCCLSNNALGSEVIQELQYGESLVFHSENHKPLNVNRTLPKADYELGFYESTDPVNVPAATDRLWIEGLPSPADTEQIWRIINPDDPDGSGPVRNGSLVYLRHEVTLWYLAFSGGKDRSAPHLVSDPNPDSKLIIMYAGDSPASPTNRAGNMVSFFHKRDSGYVALYTAPPPYGVVWDHYPLTFLPMQFKLSRPAWPDPMAIPSPWIRDASFESPYVGRENVGSSYRYTPKGSPWTFMGKAGVTANGTAFTQGNPPAPSGEQVAFLQMGSESAIFQEVYFSTAGEYILEFKAAQRANVRTTGQDFLVYLDHTYVNTCKPEDVKQYHTYMMRFPVSEAGEHLITFQGRNSGGGDNCAFLDDIRVYPVHQ